MSRLSRGPQSAIALVLALLGCARTGPQAPPEIMYGHDKCAACGMIVSEDRHAAALVPVSGAASLFDDTGELVRFVAQHPSQQNQVAFVHDYQSRRWLPARTAFFVKDLKLSTPMGTGIVAFAERSSAESFAQPRQARVLRWEEVLNAH
jgi:nitrous oxide reductase accessory protein NosL